MIALYDDRASGKGRRSLETTDLLRAAVVFLHASLEDLIRGVTAWKLPAAAAAALADVPLVGAIKTAKPTLADLAAHRGRTVQEVIDASVAASLAHSNYNNPATSRQRSNGSPCRQRFSIRIGTDSER